MKPLAFFSSVAAIAVALSVAGCATSSSPMSRIDANRTEYETWPLDVKQAVLDGRVEKGMTTKQVEVAIGKPSRVETKETRSSSQEIWTYKKGGGPGLKGSSVSIGTYGVGVSSAPIGTYAEEYEVVFEDGVVVSSSVPTG